jgi:hypothetical protein
MNRFIATLLTCPLSWGANANSDIERERLAAYGVAHCLHKHASGDTQREAGLALGGFFQLSAYESEQAFAAVRQYMDKHMKAPLGVYQDTNQPAALMACVQAGQSARYLAVVKAQDRHLPRKNP